MELPRLTVLNDRYAIRSVLGQLGPFEITYSAWDLNEEQQVVLREYFPVNLAVRQIRNDVIARDSESLPHFQYGYERYKKESQVLSRIKHPNVVPQLDYFEAYGTCYRVFEYHQGAVLERVLGEDSAQLAERSALSIFNSLLRRIKCRPSEWPYPRANFSPYPIPFQNRTTPCCCPSLLHRCCWPAG